MSWQTEEFNYAIEVFLANKPLEKNITKAVEEINELAVKLLQFINKPESINIEDITEEIVDCEMHFVLLKKVFPVSEEIRIKKISKFLMSKEFKQYKLLYENK